MPKSETLQMKVVAQVKEAEKRVLKLEREVRARARLQRKEWKALVGRIQSGQPIKALGERANQAGGEVRRRLDGLQRSIVSAAGVATSSQIAEITKELSRLTKKVDRLGRKPVANG